MNTPKYYGNKLLAPVPIKANGPDKPAETLMPYLPHSGLVKAVNLAMLLKRPLLLMGEPGCGKSILAKALAYEIHHNQPDADNNIKDFRDYYDEWNIKSTSKALDGLYEFDAIQRLGEGQILSQQGATKAAMTKALKKKNFITLKQMGKAFEKSKDDLSRVVLLIDEIDKADIDFPNDLLNELDKSSFTIKETGDPVRSEAKPIVIITSNEEKELPDAFLRRCVYHYIDPLDPEILRNIIKSRYYSDGYNQVEKKLIETALEQFVTIREHLRANKTSVGKNVSTSELLDWFEVIKYYHELKQQDGEDDESTAIGELIAELKHLGAGIEKIPFRQVLFKNWNTLIHFKRKAENKPSNA